MDYCAYLIKQALVETPRALSIALGEATKGGFHFKVPNANKDQQVAAAMGGELVKSLKAEGVPVHRGRVKTQESILSSGSKLPNDMLGLQAYSRGPKDVVKAVKALEGAGVEVGSAKVKLSDSYAGIHIKGTKGKVPVELQITSDPISQVGHQLQHQLVYKQKVEAPAADKEDKKIGKRVAQKLLAHSWIPKAVPQLKQLGLEVKK